MATGTNNIAKIWDFYTDINNNDDLENAKTSLSKKYGVFAATAAPASGWGTGLCPSKEEWINLNSHMKKGDIVVNGTYADNRLVKFADLLYIPRAAELSISPTTWTSPVAGGSQTVSVSYTNTDYYTVTSNKTWCTPPSGNQTATSVTISTSANTTTSYREATVTFSCVGRDGITVSKTLTVKQYGKTAISVNPTSLTFTPAGGKLTSTASPVNLSSYSVVSGATWCTVSKSNNIISVSATVNSGDERNTTVYVHGKGDYDLQNATASIAISQSSGLPIISLSPSTDWTMTSNAAASRVVNVSYTNASTYSVTASADWVTVSKSGNEVTLSVDANTGSDRSTTVRFGVTGTYSGTFVYDDIIVNQEGASSLTVSPTSWTVPLDGGSQTVTGAPTNLTTYYATSSVSWAKATKNGNTITISATAANGTSRNGTITLYGTGDSDKVYRTAQVSISQASGYPSISVSPTSKELTPVAATNTATVTRTYINGYASVASNAIGWLNCTISGDTITYSVTNNTSSARTGTIYVHGTGLYGGVGVTCTLVVSQSNGTPTISTDLTTLSYTKDGGSKNVTVYLTNITSSNYTASSNQTWCTVTQSGTTLTIKCDKTNSSSTRTATVTLNGTGTYGSSDSCTISISQEGGAPSLSVSPTSWNMTSNAAASKSFTVTTSNVGAFNVGSLASWLTVSATSSTSFTLQATKNTNADRSDTIYVSAIGSYTNTGVTASVTISQEGSSSLSVSPLTHDMSPAAASESSTVTAYNMTDWYVSATSSTGWLTASKGSDKVNFSVTKNTGSARKGTIFVYGTGDSDGIASTATITINQESGQSSLSISSDAKYTPAAQSDKTATVTRTNVSTYGVTRGSATWTTVSQSGNTVNYSMTINTGAARTATITVYGTGDYTEESLSDYIYVSQSSGKSSIYIKDYQFFASAAGQSKTVSASATNISSIFVDSNDSPSWASASISGVNVTLYAAKNTGAARTATIYIAGTGTYDGIKRRDYVKIGQASGESSLSISSDANYTPAAQSGTATVTRTNISTYGVTRGNAAWLTVSATGDIVNYSITANSGAARTATITVYGTGTYDNTKKTSSIYVSQASGKPSITVNPSSITNAGATATNTNITVTPTNVSTWQATSNVTWATPTKSGNSLTIALSANTGTVRSGKVFVHGSGDYGGSATATIPISQVTGTSSISVSPDRYEFNPAGESKTVTITLTNMSSYSIETSLDWITTSKNGNDVALTADPNNTIDSRDGYVYFKGTGNIDGVARKAHIYVTQGSNSITVKIDGSSSVTERDIPPSGGGTLEYPITLTNVTTSYVTASVNWLTPEINNEYLYIDIGVNRSSARSGYVYLVGSNSSTNATASVFVSQNSGVSSISISPTSVTAPVAGTSYKIPVTLTNASTYIISESYDWIETSKSGNTATITVAQNISSSSRSATVSFYTTGTYDNTKRTVDFNIQQPAATISISPDSLNFDYDGGSQTCTVSGGTINAATTAESSWISYTFNSNSITITVTANPTTLARTGTLHVDINGQIKPVSIYQSGSPDKPGGTSTVTVAAGGWISVTTPISGYYAYQSDSNHNIGDSISTCRVYTSGKSGSFTIYINNHSEANYDYTVAGKLDTDLPSSASQLLYTSGQGSSRGRTAGLATNLSGWTAVTYTIPNPSQHWIEVAYRKDDSVDKGNDRGYLLVPIVW